MHLCAVPTPETRGMLVIIVALMITSTVSISHWQQYQRFFHPSLAKATTALFSCSISDLTGSW
jgi:hypothetical protein